MNIEQFYARNQQLLALPHRTEDYSLSLTSRRRDFILSKNVRSETVYKTFQRAKFKLKCIMFWSNIIKEIRIYGTGSSLFDGSKNYKQNLPKIMNTKKIGKVEKKYNIVKVERKCVILPYSLFYKVWNIVLAFALMYTCTVMPWVLAFEEVVIGEGWFIIDTLIDIIYCFDIIVTSNLAFSDKKGKLIDSRSTILYNYMKGMLFFDILAIIPFNLLMNSSNKVNSYIKLLRLARMVRLLKALKLKKIIESFSNGQRATYLALNRLIVGLILILMLIHFTSCIWNFIPRLENNGPTTWLFRYNYLEKTSSEKYLTGVYFAVTTIMTVGFGDISAHSKIEMIVCIILELVGIGFYSFILGVMTTLLTSIDHKEVLLKSRMQMVSLFSKDTFLAKEMSKKMSREIKFYYEHLILDDDERLGILMRIPKKLKYKMSLSMYKCQVNKIFFLNQQDKSFISEFVPRLVYYKYEARKKIFSQGDYPDEMYFLMKGRVAFVFSKRNMVFKTVIAGSYFGEIGLIERSPREFGAITLKVCEMLIMSAQLFNEVIIQFPQIYAYMKDIADQKKKKNKQNRQDIIDLLEIFEVRKSMKIEDLAGLKRVEQRCENHKNLKVCTNTIMDFEDNMELQNKMYKEQLKLIRKRLRSLGEKLEKTCKLFCDNISSFVN
ncbi:hypothetical protein SteCoe_2655 [Stentor coeruleus]|uniref:Cyclic nucleotide-binding domain-containing protein n=1 Tax=Stentor coeruleus TaxID=5963 RepID=A0A1R2CYT9_9CILI|nr:hypothetical protein SteCoe_2655 [Stentor coeruleus]